MHFVLPFRECVKASEDKDFHDRLLPDAAWQLYLANPICAIASAPVIAAGLNG
jgi:hypothetical protein